jgi:hypothetical protein
VFFALAVAAGCGSQGGAHEGTASDGGADVSAASSSGASSGAGASSSGGGGSGTTSSGSSSSSTSTSTSSSGGTSSTSSGGPADSGQILPPVDGGLGPAQFAAGELDPPSHGGTITFTQIGSNKDTDGGAAWYPSMRDPKTGPCDPTISTSTCCRTQYDITSNALTPWDEELIFTLRGPIIVKQLAVYQAASADPTAEWQLVSSWDSAASNGFNFVGKATSTGNFAGQVGSECNVDVSSGVPFTCGAGSVPYCTGSNLHLGWPGSKLWVMLAFMPHDGTAKGIASCGSTTNGWWDAPWLGTGVGELSRAGAFAGCQCFAKDPAKWYLADGCGQFNVFEVVNDNNTYRNLDIFSTDFIDYSGYVGQGPCAAACSNAATLPSSVDLIDKKTNMEAAVGGQATPAGFMGDASALRRPAAGYRYFLVAFDIPTRTVQEAVIHPQNIPASISGLLPNLPGSIARPVVDSVLKLSLPH